VMAFDPTGMHPLGRHKLLGPTAPLSWMASPSRAIWWGTIRFELASRCAPSSPLSPGGLEGAAGNVV